MKGGTGCFFTTALVAMDVSGEEVTRVMKKRRGHFETRVFKTKRYVINYLAYCLILR